MQQLNTTCYIYSNTDVLKLSAKFLKVRKKMSLAKHHLCELKNMHTKTPHKNIFKLKDTCWYIRMTADWRKKEMGVENSSIKGGLSKMKSEFSVANSKNQLWLI